MCASGVRDRLAEMQRLQKDTEMVTKKKSKKNSEKEDDVQKVLLRVGQIEKCLKNIERETETMIKLQSDILSNPFCDKKQILQLDRTVANIQTKLTEVRADLRKLENENIENKKLGSETAVARVKDQQVNRLTTDLARATNNFYKGQADYMEKMKCRVKKQLAITGFHGDMSESDINNILDNDSYSVFTQNFISDVTDAEKSLREIEEREKEILALEKSVVKVNELFRDMNILVAEQGETLDTIEANIGQAGGQVTSANVQLKRAGEYSSKARRKKFCIVGIVLIVITIIILIVVLAVKV